VSLLRIGLQVAVTFAEVVERVARELAVSVEARDVVVDGPVVDDVGVPLR